jgi:hypothetical protein
MVMFSDNAIRVCLSKKVYRSKVEADLASAEIWAMTGRDLSKYTCNVCKRYHLTSRQKWTT